MADHEGFQPQDFLGRRLRERVFPKFDAEKARTALEKFLRDGNGEILAFLAAGDTEGAAAVQAREARFRALVSDPAADISAWKEFQPLLARAIETEQQKLHAAMAAEKKHITEHLAGLRLLLEFLEEKYVGKIAA